jgi:hypothetical protein
MTVRQPRYSKEELARRGDEIYESRVRQQVEEGNYGKMVAIASKPGHLRWQTIRLPRLTASTNVS